MHYRRLATGFEAVHKTKSIAIPGYESFAFFAKRQDDPLTDHEKEYATPPKSWCIYEQSTGRSAGWAPTCDAAIAQAKTWFDGMGGPDWLTSLIANSPKVPANDLFGESE